MWLARGVSGCFLDDICVGVAPSIPPSLGRGAPSIGRAVGLSELSVGPTGRDSGSILRRIVPSRSDESSVGCLDRSLCLVDLRAQFSEVGHLFDFVLK